MFADGVPNTSGCLAFINLQLLTSYQQHLHFFFLWQQLERTVKLFGFPLICSEYHLSSDRAHLHEMGYKYYNLRLFCPFPVGKLIRMNKQINSGLFFFNILLFIYNLCECFFIFCSCKKKKKTTCSLCAELHFNVCIH